MHFKSKCHKQFDKCENIVLFLQYIGINNVDEEFYVYFIDCKKKFDDYLVKCHFNIVFTDYEYAPYIMSKLSNKKTMIS